jgi:hypothetical protein
MASIRERLIAMTVAHDERRQVLNPRVTWDGSIEQFEAFRNNVEGYLVSVLFNITKITVIDLLGTRSCA